MNIFVLSDNPVEAAQMQCDKHVVKMILETAQMLSTAHHLCGSADAIMYKPTHKNHPCSVWARQSKANYKWLFDHFLALCEEYTNRYGKVHLCETKLASVLNRFPSGISNKECTPFALAMQHEPECIVKGDPVQSYRNYYKTKKDKFSMVWTNREVPEWFK